MIKIALRLFASILLVLTISGTAEAVQPKVNRNASSTASKPKTQPNPNPGRSKGSSKSQTSRKKNTIGPDLLIQSLDRTPNSPVDAMMSFLDGVCSENMDLIIASLSKETQRQVLNQINEYGEEYVYNELMENQSLLDYKNNVYDGWDLGFIDFGDSENFGIVYLPRAYIGNTVVINIDALWDNGWEVVRFRLKRESGKWKVRKVK